MTHVDFAKIILTFDDNSNHWQLLAQTLALMIIEPQSGAINSPPASPPTSAEHGARSDADWPLGQGRWRLELDNVKDLIQSSTGCPPGLINAARLMMEELEWWRGKAERGEIVGK